MILPWRRGETGARDSSWPVVNQVVGAQRSKRWLTIATGISLLVIAATVAVVVAVARLKDEPVQVVPQGGLVTGVDSPAESALPRATPGEEAPLGAELPPAEVLDRTGFDIMVEPRGATVKLDGSPIGPAPLRVRRLVPGRHTIEVGGVPGHGTEQRQVRLKAGQAEVVRVILRPAGGTGPAAARPPREPPDAQSSAPRDPPGGEARRAAADLRREALRREAAQESDGATGILMLASKPPCQILIDGQRTGLTTPHRSLKLPAGRHTITLVNEEHGIRERFTVTIRPGKATRVLKDMRDRLR
jgi:hypothetical protein